MFSSVGNAEGLPFVPFSFLALPTEAQAYQEASIVVLPVPYDGTASFKAGAREGPEAIIGASRELEDYDIELGCEPSSAGIYTLPLLEPDLGSPEGMVQRVARAAQRVGQEGKVLALLGGDHSVTIGAVRAMAALYPDLSVLYLDAHADFREEYLGTRWGHASTARRLAEMCPVTLVGVRSMSSQEAEALRVQKVPVFPPVPDTPNTAWDNVIGHLSPHVYVSVDLDVFDPSLMPAVGTPEPGGMGWDQVLRLLCLVGGLRQMVGFDVVELAPKEGPASCSYIAARLTYKLMGYATALRPKS